MSDARLNAYEFTGVLIPGAALVFSYLVCAGENMPEAMEKVSIGGLGLFGVLCFVVGHIIQALGNILASVWWRVRGMPSTWLLKGNPPLMGKAQSERVIAGLIHFGMVSDRSSLEQLKRFEWEGLTAEVYARVAAAGQQHRIDAFNATFGLFRGLVSAFALAIGMAFGSRSSLWCVFGLALILSLTRMERFARHYARELYVQFLAIIDSSRAHSTTDARGDNDAD